jgi:hypothetical protein
VTLRTTIDVAREINADYDDLLGFAREVGLPRAGNAYLWNDDAIDAYLDDCDGDDGDEDDEADDGDDEDDDED